jgi:hypothetical protein
LAAIGTVSRQSSPKSHLGVGLRLASKCSHILEQSPQCVSCCRTAFHGQIHHVLRALTIEGEHAVIHSADHHVSSSFIAAFQRRNSMSPVRLGCLQGVSLMFTIFIAGNGECDARHNPLFVSRQAGGSLHDAGVEAIAYRSKKRGQCETAAKLMAVNTVRLQ